jgi:hypothetical protein
LQLKEFEQATMRGEIEKVLGMHEELMAKLTQARDLSTQLSAGELAEFAPKLDGADKRIATLLARALDSQGSGASAAVDPRPAEPTSPAPTKLTAREVVTLRSLHKKVDQFRRIHDYSKAEAASHRLAAELKKAQALLTGEAQAIIGTLLAKCSAHMEMHNEMQRAIQGAAPVNTYPPIGIANAGSNCWANAFLQVILNADIDTSGSAPLQAAQAGYRTAQLLGHLLARGTDSQAIRKALPTASDRVHVQEDVSTAFEHFLSSIGMDTPLEQTVETRMRGHNGDLLQKSSNTQQTRESLLKFPLIEGHNFETLFGSTFKYDSEDDHGFDVKLMATPDNLFMQAVRFNFGASAAKDNTLIQEVPEMLVMPKERIKDGQADELYELKSCIIHTGDNLNSGHYVTLVKKPTGWYLVDDAQTRKVSADELTSLLAQGYIFHYGKAS